MDVLVVHWGGAPATLPSGVPAALQRRSQFTCFHSHKHSHSHLHLHLHLHSHLHLEPSQAHPHAQAQGSALYYIDIDTHIHIQAEKALERSYTHMGDLERSAKQMEELNAAEVGAMRAVEKDLALLKEKTFTEGQKLCVACHIRAVAILGHLPY